MTVLAWWTEPGGGGRASVGMQPGEVRVTEPERSLEATGDVDVGTFEAFYRSTRGSTSAVVMALRGPRVGVEEVAQEAYLRAYRRWDRVAAMDRPDLWVHTVALNLAMSRLRRLGSEARAMARLSGRRQLVSASVEPSTEGFWQLVRQLPRRQGQAVALRYAADLPIADIAAVLGCAEGTVKSHLHAARTTLAELLDEDGP